MDIKHVKEKSHYYFFIMLINGILLFSGLILMYLKGFSVISVNPVLVNIIGLSLIIPNAFLMIRRFMKSKP